MGLFKKISQAFGGKPATPTLEARARDSIAGMTTPEGRAQHMQFLALHPECLDLTDARGKSALDHAALAGDMETLAQLINDGIKKDFYHDAINAACMGGSQQALAMLLAAGGKITERHLTTLRTLAGILNSPETPSSDSADPLIRALNMMETAFKVQEDDSLAEQSGPTVLGRDMEVHRPLKLKLQTRRDFMKMKV